MLLSLSSVETSSANSNNTIVTYIINGAERREFDPKEACYQRPPITLTCIFIGYLIDSTYLTYLQLICWYSFIELRLQIVYRIALAFHNWLLISRPSLTAFQSMLVFKFFLIQFFCEDEPNGYTQRFLLLASP